MRHLLFCALLLPGSAMAEIYRWIDEQGRVHFGQQPPAGAEQVEVRPQVVEQDEATRERLERTERFFDARQEEREQAAAEAAEREIERQKHEQECSRLRGQLAQLEEGGRFYRRDAQGEPVFFSDDEIAAARRELSDQLAMHCG
jgi:hypothetical protein